jgi:Bacterial protein of unknown function (DUF839)
MSWTRRSVTVVAALLLAGAVAIGAGADGGGFNTAIKPYTKAVPGSGWETRAVLSVGDRVPETGHPGLEYQMIGIPDGLGASTVHNGHESFVDVFMNHELVKTTTTQPIVGRPYQRGAFVSEYRLTEEGTVLSGNRAFDTVYAENTLVGPAADASNATPAFARFCSGFLATPQTTGFDRPIYLTGEETGASGTFDGRGGQTVAVFDDELHTLPKLGRFPKENSVVMPHTGRTTAVVSLEDGPTTPDSQLYLYVGEKELSGTTLHRNGLDNGRLYVFAAKSGPSTEAANGTPGTTVDGEWKLIPNAESLTEAQLEAAADAVGAFGFVRIEDGAFDLSHRDFYFVTTGEGPPINALGRLYHLRFGPTPLADAQLTTLYNADLLQPDEDGPMSPDNVDVSGHWIAINEDGTANSRPQMEARDRDGSIWLVNKDDASDRHRVGELVGRAEGGRDNIHTGAGIWETSGIIDSAKVFEDSSFLFDVQAHSPTTPPGPDTSEDGQLLLLLRSGH